MVATATDFKNNIGKYLDLSATEDILITRNGKGVAMLTGVVDGVMAAFREMRGILKKGDDRDAIREERLGKLIDKGTD
ncbi:MAG: type II toxin-antitoxin system Phd/YefM family antitoxin [Clostridiales bacterium]|nr:type II toxin-antitoxin system Phd/YefM family antitoxin [Clostridiales bacterium]MDR2749287.1 type II toxin-antitoxin system Phd/YefM family antitoxin [Clostridiales bacterium]